MDNKLLSLKISERIKRDFFDYQPYEDFYGISKLMLGEDKDFAIANLKWLSETISERMPVVVGKDLTLGRKMMGLHRKVLLALAPHDFDSYMLFAEWNREPSKKFWMPRRKTLLPIANDMQALADDKLDLLAISLPPGCGKLLADDTPVMTADGWKRHGDLIVGDRVVGLDGNYKRVEYVFPKNVANYEVEFTNGDKIQCHGNHEWVVYNRHTHKDEIRTTESMLNDVLETGEPNKRGHRYCFLLPFVDVMQGAEKDLPVDAYVFGAWLGDGTTNKPAVTICNTDVDIAIEFCKRGYGLKKVYEQVGCKRYEFIGLRDDLKKIGLCAVRNARQKYIPEIYLTASLKQRLDLLAGLIDTDGTKIGNGYIYSTTNEEVRDGVCALISTFGWRYGVCKHEPMLSSSGIQGKRAVYSIKFYPTYYVPCKVARKRVRVPALRRKIAIKRITPIEPVQGNCIQVEGRIYRVGKTMLPTHNSTMAIFYLTWLAGKCPDQPILTGSHSNSWIKGAYDECLRIMDAKGDYLWYEVFPYVQISGTNAKDCRIDLGKRKRFETLEFTSIGTGNAGLYRAATLLYCDDLISSLEVALSPDRLSKLWGIYNTDLRQRKIGDKCKELHIATRWATTDVISLLERQYDGDDRAKFISIPALNENDESNFDYAYGVGFSTKFYHEQRDIMDDINWRALYMQQPLDREGRLYDPDELRRYFELPDGQPDMIISVCDTKDRGSDDACMPVAYVYGDNYYIEDILCDNSKPEVVDELLIQMLLKHKVQLSCFESNAAGGRVAQTVQAGVKARGGITKIETRYTTQNKETKILANSPWVKEHCLFKDDTVSDKNYKKVINKLCGYSVSSRNKHDDVCDAFAQLAIYAESMGGAKVKVIPRLW